MHEDNSHWANDPDLVLTDEHLRYLYDIAHALDAERPEYLQFEKQPE